MQQFQSLKRLLTFYTLTLLIMLTLYYVTVFMELQTHSKQHSVDVFNALQHEVTEDITPTNDQIEKILAKPFFQNISYQLILMLPSGQTYVHRYTRAGERKFSTVTFPSIKSKNPDNIGAYELTTHKLTGMLNLESGEQLYVVLRHQPTDIDWIAYQYWLPLMVAIILFMTALLYMLRRRANWEQLLLYTDNLTTTSKESYSPPPFTEEKTTLEFLRLGHALGRVSYQLHHKHRRIKTLSHRLERLVDRAPLPMLMIMRQGQISFFNQRFEQVFTTSFQRDTTYTLTDFVSGSDKITQQHLHKLTSQRVTRTLLVYGLEDKQAYQLHITPWFGEHGQIHGFTALFNNVDKFISQNDSLQQQNQQLQQQLVKLAELRAVISHELRTPLNAIVGTLDLVEPQNLDARQQVVLDTLIQSSQSMLTMLNDMLDMAKIEAGKIDIVHEPVDIFKLSQHVSDLMVGNARRKNLELLYFFTPDCPRYINTDSSRLRQILLNLLDNALKFTPSGYAALVIEPISYQQMQDIVNNAAVETTIVENTVIDNHQPNIKTATTIQTPMLQLSPVTSHQWLKHVTSKQQSWVRFKIQDSGIGITAAEQSQLFAYFNQANAQISGQFGGTGLGLAISNSFAQLLGGFIKLSSQKEVGSTFHLYLPCRSPSYQPIYHFHSNLEHVHLIAIVNQALSATYLQRLCQHLSIRADIYSTFDAHARQQMATLLAAPTPTRTPILLLDYEYYVANIITATNSRYPDQTSALAALEIPSTNATLYDFMQSATLAKILLSMKPERGIPSALLDKFDGFLTKPLDIALLLSELSRLTNPTNKALTPNRSVNHSNSGNLQNKSADFKTPVSEQPTDQNLPIIRTAESESVKPVILVVEDNVTNQKITCKMLDKLGYQSVVAENGRQALEKLKEQPQDFALILMDCRMPVMDGLQATQAIRAQGDDITIIALTANNSDEDRDACLAVGMDEFLTKPINKDQLQALLQQFINP